MKRRYLLEKLKTKDGSVGLLTLLFTAMVIIFLLIPLSAYLFEKILLEILYCEISDTLELGSFRVIHAMDVSALSQKELMIQDSFIEAINMELMTIHQPQLESIEVIDIVLKDHLASLTLSVELQTTLYRKIFLMNQHYNWQYSFSIPLDSS